MKWFLWILWCSVSHAAFDPTYQKWDHLIHQYVLNQDGSTTVKFSEWRSNPVSLSELKDAVLEIESVTEVDFSRFSIDEKKAYLVNAYHLGWLSGILENPPIQSLKELNGWFRPFGRKKEIRVAGIKTPLDSIRYDLLKGVYNDPDLYFVLSQFARSSAPLLGSPFLGSKFQAQVLAQVQSFFANRKLNWMDPDHGVLHLSMLAKMAAKDLDGKGYSVKSYATRWMTSTPSERAKFEDRKVVVRFSDFDWRLAEANPQSH